MVLQQDIDEVRREATCTKRKLDNFEHEAAQMSQRFRTELEITRREYESKIHTMQEEHSREIMEVRSLIQNIQQQDRPQGHPPQDQQHAPEIETVNHKESLLIDVIANAYGIDSNMVGNMRVRVNGNLLRTMLRKHKNFLSKDKLSNSPRGTVVPHEHVSELLDNLRHFCPVLYHNDDESVEYCIN